MSRPAKIRAWRTSNTPAAIGSLPIPDPRRWPVNVRNWYSEVTGDDRGTLHVFIFHHSPMMAAMYLQDAVTAIGILDVDPSEWHIENGFPAFQFAPEKIGDYSRRLRAAGYVVGVLKPVEKSVTRQTARRARVSGAAVIDIATAQLQTRADGTSTRATWA
jgi:hypothetical protein